MNKEQARRFGDYIKYHRQEKKMSGRELARQASIDTATLVRLEQGGFAQDDPEGGRVLALQDLLAFQTGCGHLIDLVRMVDGEQGPRVLLRLQQPVQRGALRLIKGAEDSFLGAHQCEFDLRQALAAGARQHHGVPAPVFRGASKMTMFASAATPSVRIRPAIPGSVIVIGISLTRAKKKIA